jgi:hypothetical protein
VLVQIPLAAFQFLQLGAADHVQGTLYLAGAGAHVISAIVVIGAIWILSGGAEDVLRAWRLPVVAALFFIPFLADAKQVIVALPAVVLATSWRGGRTALLTRWALVGASVVALFTLVPAGDTAGRFIERSVQGQGGKQATALLVWQELEDDPAALAFGKGPAQTVSRAAFMTTDVYQRSASPLAALGLRPATISLEAERRSLEVSDGGTSFNTGVSSTLGVLGDLGVIGLIAYLGLLLSLFLRLRTDTSPEGIAAAAGFALFLVLGLVFDWWEQPPFGVFLGVLAGLGLTAKDNMGYAKGHPGPMTR